MFNPHTALCQIMTSVLPKELAQAKELMDQAKLDEALEIIEQFEKLESLSPEDQLSTLLIKGRIYLYKQRIRKAQQPYEVAYQMSQELGLVTESVIALTGKAAIHFTGDRDEALKYVLDAEKRLKTLADDPSIWLLKRDLLFVKSRVLILQGNYKEAGELAEESMRLTKEEELGNRLDLAIIYFLSGVINLEQSNLSQALEYAMKSLEENTELNHAVAIAESSYLIATIYLREGNYDQAMQYCKQSLSIKEISKQVKFEALMTYAEIYYIKSEMNRSLKYLQQALTIAEELNIAYPLLRSLSQIGYHYVITGNYSKAIENLERLLVLSEKWDSSFNMAFALSFLTMVYINQESREIANRFFTRLSILYDKTKDEGTIDIYLNYLYAKAYMMKTSTRIRDRAEAQILFKELIEKGSGDALIYALANLCNLLLEELSMYNDPEILDEIVPLINKGLEMAESARNYRWLANIKFLQAKLALIQMDTEEAKRLMVQGQRIADLHGLNYLARRISSDLDYLLDQLDSWDAVKKEDIPISERIKLAATNEVLENLQGKRVVEPPELVDEKSILLMIIAEGGILVFSYPFSEEWNFDDEIFGSFLTAFNSISDEIFSEGLDRVKFGKQTVLMEQISNFSICYLFKGQTYIAQQKLTKFVEGIQKNTSLLQNLERHFKANQILELKDSPQLESLITEIFTSTI